MTANVEKTDILNPISRVILNGIYDPDSPFYLLAGMHHILKAIWHDVLTYYKSKIKIGNSVDFFSVKVKWGHSYNELDPPSDWLVRFPDPSDININMMPFVMAKRFKETKLPDNLRIYWDQIVAQCIVSNEVGKIGYLTIHESFVEKGKTQRTPGIHTESPGVITLKGKGELNCTKKSFWGKGSVGATLELHGGIYMVSNVPNSCRVWNCKILPPHDNSPDIVGQHGDIEHLRSFLPSSSEVMDANIMYWLTDRTPHEALPLTEGTYRQFVRVVTSQLTYWHEEDNTKNPFGIVPDPSITKIIKGSKFDSICYLGDV